MWRLVSAGHWDKIVLMHSEANSDLVGMSFDEIAARRGVDPYDAALDLLLEEGENMNHLMWTSQSFSDGDVKLALSRPECAVISDTLVIGVFRVGSVIKVRSISQERQFAQGSRYGSGPKPHHDPVAVLRNRPRADARSTPSFSSASNSTEWRQ